MTTSDVDTLRELAAELQSRANQTDERVGIGFEECEVLPAMDSSESEDYGYWMAMEEAAGAVLAAVKAVEDRSPNEWLLVAAHAIEQALATGSAAAGSLHLGHFESTAPMLDEVVTHLEAAAQVIR